MFLGWHCLVLRFYLLIIKAGPPSFVPSACCLRAQPIDLQEALVLRRVSAMRETGGRQPMRKTHILTLSCEDRPGLVAAVAGLLYSHGCKLDRKSTRLNSSH